jgi:DNA-directed RNA polymerase
MSKGLLMFAEAKPISNFVQQSYYYVHGANMFGIKGTLDERVAWVEDNKEWLMRMGASPLEDTGWAKASKPFQFLAWLMDYVDYENYGAYHLSRIPVQMDGSCNGLQIISLITADNIIGEKTNCVPIKYPADVYGEVADNVITKLQNNPDNINLRLLRDYTIDRELMKKAVMTVPYGASYYTVFDLFYESFLNDCDMNVNKYSRVKRLATRLANVTWEVLKETLPTALEFREYLKDKIRRVIISGKEVSWVNPIGLRVHQGYRRQVKKRITTAIGKQFRRNTQYNEETDSLSIRDNLKGIVPNYIHSIDSSLMMLTTLAMKDKGITNLAMVHDSFATHACDAPELAKNLRQVASQIFSENLIKRFDMDIHDCYPEIQESQTPFKRGALDINQLTKSLYFFH